ncbi:unnamed protein product [Brugia pahangi]|uniref:Transcriptional regulator n=1 Tax=Brugia pahangi TaxID=6280 RepID=A0A0N4TWH1_BRUPA|nr:unnamed protein product [Brugia pahangi]
MKSISGTGGTHFLRRTELLLFIRHIYRTETYAKSIAIISAPFLMWMWYCDGHFGFVLSKEVAVMGTITADEVNFQHLLGRTERLCAESISFNILKLNAALKEMEELYDRLQKNR